MGQRVCQFVGQVGGRCKKGWLLQKVGFWQLLQLCCRRGTTRPRHASPTVYPVVPARNSVLCQWARRGASPPLVSFRARDDLIWTVEEVKRPGAEVTRHIVRVLDVPVVSHCIRVMGRGLSWAWAHIYWTRKPINFMGRHIFLRSWCCQWSETDRSNSCWTIEVTRELEVEGS